MRQKLQVSRCLMTGVAVVLFAVVLQLAQSPTADFTFGTVLWLLAKEAIGGLLLGMVLGFSASKAIKRIDDYIISVLITLSVVMGGYLVSQAMHISGPLTMVAAGLIIGNYGKRVAMSSVTKDYLNKFWELIDEILNALLFLFIGFELLLIPNIESYWTISTVTIFIVLLARLLSIWLPSLFIPFKERFSRGTLAVLVWGGLRGGVSIALALSVESGIYKEMLLEMTYFVVVFSVIVQGLTVGKLSKRAFN